MRNDLEILRAHILARTSVLAIRSMEDDRCLAELWQIAEAVPPNRRPLYVWSRLGGWLEFASMNTSEDKPKGADPRTAITEIMGLPEDALFVLRDFGPYVAPSRYPEADVVVASLRDLRGAFAASGRMLIFLGSESPKLPGIGGDALRLEFGMPDDAEIALTATTHSEYPPDRQLLGQIVAACRGMTTRQIDEALAMHHHGVWQPSIVTSLSDLRAGILEASGLFRRLAPSPNLDQLPGWTTLKWHVAVAMGKLTAGLHEAGVALSRGLLLAGLPGLGKTCASRCTAASMGLPAVELLLPAWLRRDTERSVAERALAQLDRISPCVLLVDRIERAFHPLLLNRSATVELFVDWMFSQTRTAYVMATADEISHFPQQLIGGCAFDEILAAELPQADERMYQLGARLTKLDHRVSVDDLEIISQLTNAFTRRDLNVIVDTAVVLAHSVKQPLAADHLHAALMGVRSSLRRNPQAVMQMSDWLVANAISAGSGPGEQSSASDGRQLRFGS